MLGHVHDRIHGNLRIGLDQAGKRRELSDGSPGPRTGARPTAPRQGGLKYGVFKRERPRQQALVLTDCEPCGLRGPSRRSMVAELRHAEAEIPTGLGWAHPGQQGRCGEGRSEPWCHQLRVQRLPRALASPPPRGQEPSLLQRGWRTRWERVQGTQPGQRDRQTAGTAPGRCPPALLSRRQS